MNTSLLQGKKQKKMKNYGQSVFDKNGTPQVNGRVTHWLASGRGRTYVKKEKKCDLMPFTASKSDKAHSCAKYLMIFHDR